MLLNLILLHFTIFSTIIFDLKFRCICCLLRIFSLISQFGHLRRSAKLRSGTFTSVLVCVLFAQRIRQETPSKIQRYYSRVIESDIGRNHRSEKSPRALSAAVCLACPRIVAAMPATSKRKRCAIIAVPPAANPVLIANDRVLRMSSATRRPPHAPDARASRSPALARASCGTSSRRRRSSSRARRRLKTSNPRH